MSPIESTSTVTSIISMVSSSTSSMRAMPSGLGGWGGAGLHAPSPDHPRPMGTLGNGGPSHPEDSKPLAPWTIVLIVIVLGSMIVGFGSLLWLGRKPSISKKEREEARREIDLERASLEAEAKWQTSLKRKAEAQAQANGKGGKQGGEMVEMEEKNITEPDSEEGEKVVVGKLGKGDDMV